MRHKCIRSLPEFRSTCLSRVTVALPSLQIVSHRVIDASGISRSELQRQPGPFNLTKVTALPASMIPDTIPVMTLPATVFFPRTLLPLFIFEPRYRAMLAETLDAHRVFAVALLDQTEPANETPHRIATAGVIRACQKNHDGTSNLILEGLSRVEIVEVVRERPYRLIRVQPIAAPTVAPSAAIERLREQLLSLLSEQTQYEPEIRTRLTDTLQAIDDPSVFCDLLVHSVTKNVRFRQRVLEIIDPVQRLRQAIDHFQAEREKNRLAQRLRGSLSDDEVELN